jgi:hypothetical protein
MVLSSLSGIWHISLLSFKTSNMNAFTIFVSDFVFLFVLEFTDLYVSNTAIHYIQHSPVLAPSCQSQTHDDFVIAQVLQEELQHAKDPEAECLHADIIPGPTNVITICGLCYNCTRL